MNPVFQWIAVFASCVVFDFTYLAWLHAARDNRLWAATAWAPVVAAVSLFGVLGVVSSQVLVIPYLAGQAFGTWLSVWLRRRGGCKVAGAGPD